MSLIGDWIVSIVLFAVHADFRRYLGGCVSTARNAKKPLSRGGSCRRHSQNRVEEKLKKPAEPISIAALSHCICWRSLGDRMFPVKSGAWKKVWARRAALGCNAFQKSSPKPLSLIVSAMMARRMSAARSLRRRSLHPRPLLTPRDRMGRGRPMARAQAATARQQRRAAKSLWGIKSWCW